MTTSLPPMPPKNTIPGNPDDPGTQFNGLVFGQNPQPTPTVNPGVLNEFFGSQADDSGTSGKSGKWCYWKKAETFVDGVPAPDAGWIIVAPAWPSETMRQLDKGMTPLRRYGEFTLNQAQENWRVHHESFRRIFQLGGAHEFPVEQIVQFNWHRRPPYRGVTFNQLTGIEIPDFACPVCPNRHFATAENLQSHERVMHSEDRQNNNLARTLATTTGQMNEPLAQFLAQLQQSNLQSNQILAALVERLVRVETLASQSEQAVVSSPVVEEVTATPLDDVAVPTARTQRKAPAKRKPGRPRKSPAKT